MTAQPRRRGTGSFRLLLTGLAAALVAGCPAATPLEVEYHGCTALLVGGPAAPGVEPTCVLDGLRKVTLWVPKRPETTLEIRAGRPLTALKEHPSGAGTRYELEVPPEADRLEVIARGPGRSQVRWSLRISPQRNVAQEISRDAQEIHKHIEDFRLAEARAKLDRLEAIALPDQLASRSRYLLTYYRGLLAEKEGDFRTALAKLEEAVEIARRLGLKDELRAAQVAQALRFTELGRSSEAQEIYADLNGRVTSDTDTAPCDKVELRSNWAWNTLLAREAGGGYSAPELAEPLPRLEKARSEFAACGDLVVDVRLNLVLAHLQAGSTKEADLELVAADALAAGGTLFQYLWYLDLQGRLELARDQPRRALDFYVQLEDIARASGSADGLLRATLGRARATAALGQRDQALALLETAEELLDGDSLRIPLHQGRETFVSQREGVSSLVIELLLAAGRDREAFAAARRARSRFLRQLATTKCLENLTPEARAAWSREIAQYRQEREQVDSEASQLWHLLDSRADRAELEEKTRELELQLAQAFEILECPVPEGLPPTRPGDLVLVFHPLAKDWVAFAADDSERVSVHRFRLDPDLLGDQAQLASEILEPFAPQIQSARRVRVLPYGVLRNIDFHALPFDDDVLLAAVPVVYGLDLPRPDPADPIPSADRSPEALLVDDPGDDLAWANREVDEIAREIESWRPAWQISRLSTDRATVEAVRDKLGQVDLFQFSGHGKFAGFGGWDSELSLAKGRLTVGDLLVLPRAPRWVVLAGCETARTAASSLEGFGLANALVVAGSQGVVASVRPVADKNVGALLAQFYRNWQGQEDLATALQQAQLAWRRQNSASEDWQSFRLVEP